MSGTTVGMTQTLVGWGVGEHTEHVGAVLVEPAAMIAASSLSALASKAPMLSSCVRPLTRRSEISTLTGWIRRNISAVM